MTGDIQPNLDRARVAVHLFGKMAADGLWEVAGREAYFVAYHSAYIILGLAGIRPGKTPSGVRSQFANLARSDVEIGADLAAVLGRAYPHKQFSDYGSGEPVTQEAAERDFVDARRLLAIAERRAAGARA